LSVIDAAQQQVPPFVAGDVDSPPGKVTLRLESRVPMQIQERKWSGHEPPHGDDIGGIGIQADLERRCIVHAQAFLDALDFVRHDLDDTFGIGLSEPVAYLVKEAVEGSEPFGCANGFWRSVR
jgi:hypothetical protein